MAKAALLGLAASLALAASSAQLLAGEKATTITAIPGVIAGQCEMGTRLVWAR